MRPCVARISSPYRSTNGVAIGLGQHAEAMRQSDQVANFGRRAQCYVQVVQVVALGPACTALHDVRRHRDCGSTKLRLEAVALLGRKGLRAPVGERHQVVRQAKHLELVVIARHPLRPEA